MNENFEESDIQDYQSRLSEALMALASSIKLSVIHLELLNDEQKMELTSLLADIATYQDDIISIAAK